MNARLRSMGTTLSLMVLGAAGCGRAENTDNAVVQDTAAMPMDNGMVGMPMGGMSAQDGHHEFLRMQSNHHEGLVQLATAAMDKAQQQTTKNDAHKLYEKQAMERDSMVAMIHRDYQEQHQVRMMAKNAAQADSLNALTGIEYDRTFYRMAIDHHREGIGMIDQHMAHLTRPEVRQMAERMRADQLKEIAEFEAKLRAL